ncbi:MAG: hypothetical protein JWP32_2876 [Schumannella sp.]|nr:hypothetical protein [Schumannella sp.]
MTDKITCPPGHKHGRAGTCYNEHRCRCEACVDHNRLVKRRAYRLRAYGLPTSNLVDAQPAREHIEHLQAFGIGAKQIAVMAGIQHAKVSHILWGSSVATPKRYRPPVPAKRIAQATETAILAVRPDVHALLPTTTIPARGTQRRVQALITLGWTHTELAHRMGTSPEHLSYILMHQNRVQAWTHLAAMAVFDSLWNVTPPADTRTAQTARTRMKNHAAARRWVPPLGWDDIDTDAEPPATEYDHTVDDIAVELACSGEAVRLNPAERREAIRILHPRKWSDRLMAAHADCDERTVLRIRQELGLEAWDQNELTDRRAA